MSLQKLVLLVVIKKLRMATNSSRTKLMRKGQKGDVAQ